MAVHGMFGSLGSAFGPLLAVSLATLISWRASYLDFSYFVKNLSFNNFFKYIS